MIPRNPLDVLAQHLVSMVADRRVGGGRGRGAGQGAPSPMRSSPRAARERARHARRSLPLRALRRAAAADRLGPHRGHDPRPQGRPAARRRPTPARSPTAVCTASTCPMAAASASSTRRWSTRRARGRCSCSGACTWRIEDITRDRVIVTPAPGVPGAVPFWRGDGVGRPVELGRAIGEFSREAVDAEPERSRPRLRPRRARRATNLVAYLREQQAATRVVPSDRDDRDRALPRRDRRLAALHPEPVRRPRARGLGPGAQRADPRRARARGRRDLVRRRDRRPPARRRRGPEPGAGDCSSRTRSRT